MAFRWNNRDFEFGTISPQNQYIGHVTLVLFSKNLNFIGSSNLRDFETWDFFCVEPASVWFQHHAIIWNFPSIGSVQIEHNRNEFTQIHSSSHFSSKKQTWATGLSMRLYHFAGIKEHEFSNNLFPFTCWWSNWMNLKEFLFHFWNTEYHVKDTSCQLNSISECICIVWIIIFGIKKNPHSSFLAILKQMIMTIVIVWCIYDSSQRYSCSICTTLTLGCIQAHCQKGICNQACFTKFLPCRLSILFPILLIFSCKACFNFVLYCTS